MKFVKISILPILIILVIVLIYGIQFYSNDKKEENVIEYNNSSENYLDKNVDPEKNPVMYDYIYSMVGYKMNIDTSKYGDYYALMVDNESLNEKSGTIYIEHYISDEVYPSLGSDYVKIKVNESDWSLIKNDLINWPEDLKFVEGNWTLYILISNTIAENSYSFSETLDGDIWNNLNLKLDYKDGWYKSNLDTNGWDTDWLRRYPYCNRIKSYINTDMNDDFFDKFNLNEIIEVKNISSEEYQRIKVEGSNAFRLIDDGMFLLTLEQLNERLEYQGYEQIKR